MSGRPTCHVANSAKCRGPDTTSCQLGIPEILATCDHWVSGTLDRTGGPDMRWRDDNCRERSWQLDNKQGAELATRQEAGSGVGNSNRASTRRSRTARVAKSLGWSISSCQPLRAVLGSPGESWEDGANYPGLHWGPPASSCQRCVNAALTRGRRRQRRVNAALTRGRRRQRPIHRCRTKAATRHHGAKSHRGARSKDRNR